MKKVLLLLTLYSICSTRLISQESPVYDLVIEEPTTKNSTCATNVVNGDFLKYGNLETWIPRGAQIL